MADSEDPDPRVPPSFRLVRVGVYFYAGLMAAALVWRMGFFGEPIFFVSATDRVAGIRFGHDLMAGLAAGIALVVLSSVVSAHTRWGNALARDLAAAIGPLGIPNALLLAFASGLAEEMFFRGALQPRVGLVAASVLFACMHFVPRRTLLPWTIFALGAGLLFGALFTWTGNLLAPVTAHIVVNAVNLPLLERRFGSRGEDA